MSKYFEETKNSFPFQNAKKQQQQQQQQQNIFNCLKFQILKPFPRMSEINISLAIAEDWSIINK